MKECRHCANFKPAVNIEIADEIDKAKCKRGTCSLNNNRRNSDNECSFGEFKGC